MRVLDRAHEQRQEWQWCAIIEAGSARPHRDVECEMGRAA